ncbi:MAG TPA: hypothetical protein VGC67_04405 [Cellulomonas sp.]
MEDRPGDATRRDAHPAPRSGTIGSTIAGRYRLDRPQPSDLPGAERWDATDHILARPVSVTLLTGPRTGAAVDGARRAALVVDPRLARILDVGSTDGVGYVVTEAVEGRTLAALTARAPLPADQARAVVGEVAAALEIARRRGVHHLALRPSALRVTAAGRVVLDGLAVDGELLGATGLSAHATSRADTIGLVRLLYGALTGRWPLVPEIEGTRQGPVPTFAEWTARDAASGRAAAGGAGGSVSAPAGMDDAGARTAGDVEPGLPIAPSTDSGPVPPGELVDAVPADLDTLCTVTLGPHDDGPHSPGELVRELEPWRAVRADAIYRAADVGRWPTLGGAVTGAAAAATPTPGPTTAPVPATFLPVLPAADRGTAATPAAGTGAASAPEPAPDATPEPHPTTAPGSADPAPASDVSRSAGTTTAPPTGSSPMSDDPQRSSSPAPDGTGESAEHPEHEATAEGTGVARQSVRSAFEQDDRPGTRRPGTPPPATPAPASFPPATTTSPTTPVRSSTRSAAVPPSIPPTIPPGDTATPAATPPAARPAATPPPVRPAATAAQPTAAAAAPAAGSTPEWDLPFVGEQPARSTGQRRFDPTRWVLAVVAVAVVVGVVVALANVLAPWTSSSDDDAASAATVVTPTAQASQTTATDDQTATDDGAAATVAPQIAAVSTIDPSDADGEHEELVGRLTDGDASTAWYTHTYNRSDFAGFKDAVGLVVTLTEPATVTSITLDVNGSGGNVEIRSTDAANPTTGDVLASGAMNGQTVFTLSQPTETQSIVLWFTSLSQTSDGANRIEISSLTVS